MTMATTHEHPKRSNGAKHDGAHALVSAKALAAHLCCVPTYVRKLVDQGVIERRDDGRFDQDVCRLKYLTYLRAERRQSPRAAADAEFTAAKSELIRIRVAEKRRELVKQTDVDALVDDICGVILPALSSMPAQCAPRGDLVTRRKIEQVVFQVRSDLAAIAQRKADEAGEPALDEQ